MLIKIIQRIQLQQSENDMSLRQSKKANLLQELVHLSKDEEILPYIDEGTASRIRAILEQNQSLHFLQEYQDLENNFKKRKSKTQMEELNQLYQQNFPHLFQQDESDVLKQITVQLGGNKKKAVKGDNSSQKFYKKNLLEHQDGRDIISLGTCSKFNTFKQSDQNKENTMVKKKSKQKGISYKIGKQVSKFNQNNHAKNPLDNIGSKSKTPQKKIISTVNSKSNTKMKQSSSNIKRCESQKIKFNPTSMTSSIKNDKLVGLKNSQSKSSLYSTTKLKSGSKKSFQSTAKRQIKSFSSCETPLNMRNNAREANFKERSKSRENKKKDMLKKINRINTQFSADFDVKKRDFFYESIEGQNKKGSENVSRCQRFVTQAHHTDSDHLSNKQASNSSSFERHLVANGYMKEIIGEIYSQQAEKAAEKERIQDQMERLREKIAQQSRRLQETANRNNKLIRQIETVAEFQRHIAQQRQGIQNSIKEAKKVIKTLRQKIKENTQIHKKLVEGEVKEQQQLIQMYGNVIDELRKEIREQNRKKCELKAELEKSQRKLQSKECRFNSTLMETKKIKFDLTDAFKEWV